MDFIRSLNVDMIIAILALIFIVVAWILGKKEQIEKAVYVLVIEAERIYGSGTGDIKYAVVANKINGMIPSPLNLIITNKVIDAMINNAVTYIKTETSKGVTFEGILKQLTE